MRDQLNAVANGQYRAWTRAELSKANENAMLKQQIIGIILAFAVIIGAVSGLAITWQTLRGAILGNIKEFASLRALGVSMGSLQLVVMEISFWVGIAGLAATTVLVGGIGMLATAGGVPMAFPANVVIFTGVLPARHRHAVGGLLPRHIEEEPAGGSAAMKTALRAVGLSKSFKTGRSSIEVLKGVDFDASHGELTMVMGPSGSGKSTLVAALSGLLRPDGAR